MFTVGVYSTEVSLKPVYNSQQADELSTAGIITQKALIVLD